MSVTGLIERIFEDSVIKTLEYNGISVSDRASDDFSNYKPKGVFLRESILNRLENNWVYSNSLKLKINYHVDPVTGAESWDVDQVNDFVDEFVRNEIRLETGRMQTQAEKEILKALVDDDTYSKKGLEKLYGKFVDVVSPGSSKVQKLLKTKLSDHEGIRKGVLDVVFPTTVGGLEEGIEKYEKLRRKGTRPKESTGGIISGTTPDLKFGEEFKDAFVKILESEDSKEVTASPYMATAYSIKKQYEDTTKPFREELEKLNTERNTVRINKSGRSISVIDSEIRAAQQQINLITYGSATGTTPLPGSFAERIVNERARLEDQFIINPTGPFTATTGASRTGTAPVSVVVPGRDFLLYGSGYGAVSDVWEINPSARLKIIEFTEKRDRNPLLRNHYQGLINQYTNILNSSATATGSTRETLSFKFTSNGKLELTDRLKESYDGAVKELGKNIAFVDVASQYNRFRIKTLEINSKHLNELRMTLVNKSLTTPLTPDEINLLNRTEQLMQQFIVHSQALSILEGMKFIKNGENPDFDILKNNFIANISIYESDPARRAALIAAIRAGDLKQLREMISSGDMLGHVIGKGSKNPVDLKIKSLYEEFYKIGNDAKGVSPKFTIWANKVKLDNEVIGSFITRRYIENTVYAAQLITDPKYLKKEIKRTFTREIAKRLGTPAERFFLSKFAHNPIIGPIAEFFYEAVSDEEFRKAPVKYLSTKGKERLKSILKGHLSKTDWYQNFQKYNFFGREVTIDFVDLIFDPRSYLRNLIKDYAWDGAQRLANLLFRRTAEGLFNRYTAFKKYFWRATDRFKGFAVNFLSKFGGNIGAWAAKALAGLAIPVAGWLVTAALVLVPVLLKPLFGDVDVMTAIKKMLKILLLGPCLILLLVWLVIIVPIITLFSNLWNSFSMYVGNYFNEVGLKIGLVWDRTTGGLNNWDLGSDIIDDLVTTSGNSCINEDGTPKLTDYAVPGWNNMSSRDFEGLNGDPTLNCRIMCNAKRLISTLYPGVKDPVYKDKKIVNFIRLLNCSSTPYGQQRFNKGDPGSGTDRYWCTHAVIQAYSDDFPSINIPSNLAVKSMNTWFQGMIGNGIELIDNSQCFEKDRLNSGAAIFMDASDTNCALTSQGGLHVALFLKYDDARKKVIYINSNDSALKQEVDYEECSGSGNKIRIKNKTYTSLSFQICRMYQIDANSYTPPSTSCPTDCLPAINNFND